MTIKNLLIVFILQLYHLNSCLVMHHACDACELPCFITGFLAPLPAIICAIAKQDFWYIIAHYPPILCAPRSKKFFFYSTMLPIDILIAVGLSLLILIVWLLHKVWIINYYFGNAWARHSIGSSVVHTKINGLE